MRAISLALSLLFGVCAWADPLNGSLEVGTSVSHSYDARNVLVNPAAIGFQNELNGPGPLTSVFYSVNQGLGDDVATALSFSLFGLGIESHTTPLGSFQRYHFGLGVPIQSWLFAGLRLRLQRSDVAAIGDFNALDAGLQFRPSRFFSLGVVVNSARFSSEKQFIFGATLRPFPWLDLSADLDTTSEERFKKVSYQATASAEVFSGFRLMAGYHQENQYQFGLQWTFGRGTMVGRVQPKSDTRRYVFGVMFSPLPRRQPGGSSQALRIDIDGGISEEGFGGNLFSSEKPSLASILDTLAEAEKYPPKVLVLRVESFPLGMAAAQEVFEALSRVREKGTRIVAFVGNAALKEYLIASSANDIYMERSGSLTLLGLKAESYFLKGTLNKLGVEGEFLARGKYKSAPEVFTRTESSDVHKAAVKEELAEAEKQILKILGKYRGIDAKKWREILQHALWSADDAKGAKLIDHVASFAHTLEEIEGKHLVRESARTYRDRLALPPRVAVIPLSGDILSNRVTLLALGGRGAITPSRVDKLLTRAIADKRTQAIVVRVSSGGGEILASEEIAHLVEKAGKKKPVYFSMGDAAASGGYFIAAPAKRIFADPLTLTGSIGVFLGKFNLAGTYKWLQLRKEVLSEAPYPSLFSEHQPWSEKERAILVRRMNQYYESFVSYVAETRKLTPAAVENAAQGRVWLGSSALGLKLVDQLGGLRTAIEFAAEEADLKDYETWVVSDSGGLFNFSDGVLSKEASLEAVLPKDFSRQMFWWSRLQNDPFLYISPLDSF